MFTHQRERSLAVHWIAPGIALCALAAAANAQIVNPADKQQPPKTEAELQAEQSANERLRTWEMPGITVEGQALPLYREDQLIGDYNQPRWSADRRFPTTRVYVIPAGKFEIEHWTRVKTPRNGPSTVETQYEFEVGLPHRFQIDVYGVTEKTGSEGVLDWSQQKFEVRYAFADWGEIPLNPTIYLEWEENSGVPDILETKVLLGDQITDGWYYGVNLSNEHEVSGDLTNEWEITAGVTHALQDEKLSLGGELKASLTDIHGDRGNYDKSLEIGPSMQWRPVPAMHIDVAPLIGIGPDSRQSDIYVVLGWEF